MPAITLLAEEVAPGVLPPVCMVCGGPGEVRVPVGFSWVPVWTYFLLPAGFWPFAIVYLVLRRQMTADVPACRRHRLYCLKRKLLLPVGLFVTLAVMGAPGLVDSPDARYPAWAWIGAMTIFLSTVAAAVWLRFNGVRVVAITRDEIKLAGVAPEFVEAVVAGRAEFARQQREWLQRHDRP